jgi:hypothetical protein
MGIEAGSSTYYQAKRGIVQDGLVLHLDAGVKESYSGGTAWNDLTGRSTITSLSSTNMDASSWSSDYGGIFTFDGTNDFIDFYTPDISSSSVITVEFIAFIKESYNIMVFGFSFYDFYLLSNRFGYNTAQSDIWGYSPVSLVYNQWIHCTCEMRSDVAATNNKIYLNSQQLTLSQQQGSTTTRGFNSGYGRISSWKNSLNYVINMDLSIFRIYNKALSADEVSRNFNATRHRFGL